MGELMRSHDWSSTPLGAVTNWPQALKTTVGIMLNSGHAMCLAWGPAMTLLYNDAYVPILQGRHRHALGRPLDQVWADVWPDIAPLVERAMAGNAVWMEDLPLVMDRDAGPQETWWTFCYSPVRDECGDVAGMLNICSDSTSKVLADRRLATQVERQRRLFEQAPGFVCILNGPEHIYEFVNAAHNSLFGARDYLGKTVREVMPEIASQGFFELLDNVYTTGERHVAQNVAASIEQTPGVDADERYLSFVYEPIIGETGKVTGIFIQGHDVTEAHVVQEARRVDAEFLRSVLASSKDCIKVLDLDANLLFMNAGGLRVFEVSDFNAIEGCPWLGFWQGQSHIDATAAVEAAKAGGSGHFQGILDTMAGTPKWWDVQITPILGADGKPEKLLCVSRDISGLKQAELALRNLNETLEERVAERTAGLDRVWRNSRDMLVIASADGVFRAVNPAWTRVLGYEPSEMIGHNFAEFLFLDDVAASLLAVDVTIAGEKFEGFENRYRHKDGTLRWISWQTYSEGGMIYGYARDVTTEKLHSAELDLAQDSLRQSQKLEAMGQLTGGVAHDFNNILTPIMGSLDLLQRRGLGDAREQRMIDGAMQSAERAKTLVKRLLAFARRQPLQTRAIDLGRLLGGMGHLVASTSGPRINVVIDVDADLPAVMVDPNQLELAVLNLSVNARDAMRDGGTLTISAKHQTVEFRHRANLAPGRYVLLSVADTGAGMDAATLDRATEPFFSTKGIGEGTGLGLSMVHGLTAQLGGALSLNSEPGRGTEDELWLPLSADNEILAQRLVEPANTATPAGTALLVDDEELIRLSTADMLADLGYAVVEAASAEEALALLDGGLAIDMLITDHLMPGMAGADLAAIIRQRWPDTPVLIVSGYADTDEMEFDLPRLTKPFRQEELAASIRQLTPAK